MAFLRVLLMLSPRTNHCKASSKSLILERVERFRVWICLMYLYPLLRIEAVKSHGWRADVNALQSFVEIREQLSI